MKTLTSLKNVEGNIQGFVLSIVGVAVVLAVGLIVLSNIRSTTISGPLCSGWANNATTIKNGTANCYMSDNVTTSVALVSNTSIASNATGSILTQMATIPNWIGIIITVALAFIVLGYFYNRM